MAMISRREIEKMDSYFRVLNYLSVAQLYLLDNPLLRRPLQITDVKPNVVGHWGTVPGQNFIYLHLNRIIKKYNLNMIYPQFIKEGDTIGICAPSKGVGHKLDELEESNAALRQNGYRIKETKSVRKDNDRSASAKQRTREME